MSELSPEQVAGLLRAAGAEIRSEVEALPEAVLDWHPAPGEWCVKECLGHLIEAERRGFAGRIRFLLERPADTSMAGWDQVAVARARDDCAVPAAKLVAEFSELRSGSVELVAALGAEDLELGGEHSFVGHLTVREIISEWVHHDRNHFKQMLTNVQDFAWQSMGSARRFSEPH
jgi:hypothetical protein